MHRHALRPVALQLPTRHEDARIEVKVATAVRRWWRRRCRRREGGGCSGVQLVGREEHWVGSPIPPHISILRRPIRLRQRRFAMSSLLHCSGGRSHGEVIVQRGGLLGAHRLAVLVHANAQVVHGHRCMMPLRWRQQIEHAERKAGEAAGKVRIEALRIERIEQSIGAAKQIRLRAAAAWTSGRTQRQAQLQVERTQATQFARMWHGWWTTTGAAAIAAAIGIAIVAARIAMGVLLLVLVLALLFLALRAAASTAADAHLQHLNGRPTNAVLAQLFQLQALAVLAPHIHQQRVVGYAKDARCLRRGHLLVPHVLQCLR